MAAPEITPITYQMPLTNSRAAEDAKLSGNGRYVSFQSDANFKRIGEPYYPSSCFYDNRKNVWIRDLEYDGAWSNEEGIPGAFSAVAECVNGSTSVAHQHIVLDYNGSSGVFLTDEGGKDSIMKWKRESATSGSVAWLTPQFDSVADLHS